MSKPIVRVTKLPNLNTLVIKQSEGRFFISAKDSIVIDVPGFSMLLKFLVFNGFISYRILEGILDEFKREKGTDI